MSRQYELTELIQLMKDNKVLEVQLGTLKVVLHPSSFTIKDDINDLIPQIEPIVHKDETVELPSDDEMLMWSSGYSPTIERKNDL